MSRKLEISERHEIGEFVDERPKSKRGRRGALTGLDKAKIEGLFDAFHHPDQGALREKFGGSMEAFKNHLANDVYGVSIKTIEAICNKKA
jgi:hypothetical protein